MSSINSLFPSSLRGKLGPCAVLAVSLLAGLFLEALWDWLAEPDWQKLAKQCWLLCRDNTACFLSGWRAPA